jgi:hypothetical protein
MFAEVLHFSGVVGRLVEKSSVPCRRIMKLSDGDLEPFDPEYKAKPRMRRAPQPPKQRMVRLEGSGEYVPLHWLRNNVLLLMGKGVLDLRSWQERLGCSYEQACSASKALRSDRLIEPTVGLVPGRNERMVYRLTSAGVLKLRELQA